MRPPERFVEGVHYYQSGQHWVPMIPNEKRTCEGCGEEKEGKFFFSALHLTCKRCVRANPERVRYDGTNLEKQLERNPEKRVLAPTPAMISAQERVLAQRLLARRRLIHFVKMFNPGYMDGWVHRDIARRLERFVKQIEEGKSPRLLLLMPPRHGKSKLASECLIAWALGHHPEWEIISSSYNISLPLAFSRKIRDTIVDPQYKGLFPDTTLRPDMQGLEEWGTTAGGVYRAAGVGGGITGKGAHLFIVDDPVKNWEDAASATVRDSTWDWWMSTAYTRLAPGAGVLGIQTWWHDDDWAGRIQQAMAGGDGERYEIVKYAAVNEGYDEYLVGDEIRQVPPGSPAPEGGELLRTEGTALHAERYPLEALARIKMNFLAGGNHQMWSALYQQNPVPDEGAYFRKDMMKYLPRRPEMDSKLPYTVYQAWDFSITEKEASDWIVGVCYAQDSTDNLFELDVVRFKSEDNMVIADAIIDFHRKWNPYMVGFEDGQIWKSIKSTVMRRVDEVGLKSLTYETLVPLSDKMVRAGPLRGRMQLGKVYFWKDAPWRQTVDSELLRFPAGKHDDIVDAVAWCVRLTLEHAPPRAPVSPVKPKSWKDELSRYVGGNSDGVSHMSA